VHRAAIALLVGAAVTGRAAAQLRLEAESQVADGVTLCLRATNTAGEAMHDVAPEVVYQHITVVADRAAAIQEGAAHEWRMTLPSTSATPAGRVEHDPSCWCTWSARRALRRRMCG